MDRLNV
ncbi:TPA: hypothetical protein N0F65_003725 [Lagenidium giganteum]|nr:TPA: hypothetical protein N0F65_003725 [Lagenidium giganteum]